MKPFADISRVYFLGIGGIGMSALARYFLVDGKMVSGYDKTPSAITSQLTDEGCKIHFEDNIQMLDKDAQLVIYTPAIPAAHSEYNWYKDNGYNLMKRSDALSEITKDGYNICIAGTHGKTTTSTMVSHLLRETGYGCNAFLGGISVNYSTNFWSNDSNVNVVEADEYDRSFLKLNPDIAVITSMDADHLDIYGTVEEMRSAFYQFTEKIKQEGWLLVKFGIAAKKFSVPDVSTYSLQNDSADICAKNITINNGGYVFDVVYNDKVVEEVNLLIGGMHNVENAVAAIAIGMKLNIDAQKIRSAIATFKGVKRRFEYIINVKEASASQENVVFIDDYAHHPAELSALIRSARSLFNSRRCILIFQPHLFSRTRDLAKDFAEALDLADQVILLPIYPARELPIEGVDSNLLVTYMKNKNVQVMNDEDLLNYLRTDFKEETKNNFNGTMLITAGAGSIDQLINPIKEILENQS
ncbi:MAG: UDP-N-acetylmuramate--L-alanine ligase [Ginsengibacter sp.]